MSIANIRSEVSHIIMFCSVMHFKLESNFEFESKVH